MTNQDEEYPLCSDVGCEVSEDTPISAREAGCVHCGGEMHRDHAGRWVPVRINGEGQGI